MVHPSHEDTVLGDIYLPNRDFPFFLPHKLQPKYANEDRVCAAVLLRPTLPTRWISIPCQQHVTTIRNKYVLCEIKNVSIKRTMKNTGRTILRSVRECEGNRINLHIFCLHTVNYIPKTITQQTRSVRHMECLCFHCRTNGEDEQTCPFHKKPGVRALFVESLKYDLLISHKLKENIYTCTNGPNISRLYVNDLVPDCPEQDDEMQYLSFLKDGSMSLSTEPCVQNRMAQHVRRIIKVCVIPATYTAFTKQQPYQMGK